MTRVTQWRRRLPLTLLPAVCLAAATAKEPAAGKLSVPVRVLAVAGPSELAMAGGAAALDENPPSGSASELVTSMPPQYRAAPPTPQHLETVTPDDPAVRFIVPLAERPILIEARITIDGQPFRMAREQRISQLIESLSTPAPQVSVRTEAVPTEAAATDAESNGAESSEVTPVEAVPAAVDHSLQGRLRRYVQATQRAATRDELRWLLEQWSLGPTLLVVDEHFQAMRGRQSPLFQLLDGDADGVIAAAELAAARQTLLRHDRNRDDVLSLEEIAAVAGRPPGDVDVPTRQVAPLILPGDLLQQPVSRRFTQQYTAAPSAADAAGTTEADPPAAMHDAEMQHWYDGEPDLHIEVAFDSSDPGHSRVAIAADPDASDPPTVSTHAGAITLPIAGSLLEISAVQSAAGDAKIDQVAIGAVRDGYPLFPVVDLNEDGRLTLRELRQVAQRVATLDRDGDGRIAATDVPPTIRVAVGYGATAHIPLATVRTVYPPAATPPSTAPEWFVRMDQNQDGDLTPREFLGGQQAFDDLDNDGDGLLSVDEASTSSDTDTR